MTTGSPPYSARAVANSILELAGGANVAQISPMKMQKLVFFAHGWYLANFNKPLVKEPIKAWQYGPVIKSLYHELKHYGSDPIKNFITELIFDEDVFQNITPKVSSPEALDLLKEINEVYGKYSGIQLSNISHEAGSPWERVKIECGGDLSSNDVSIPDTLIESFYTSKLNNSE